jgi:hypothetical protein
MKVQQHSDYANTDAGDRDPDPGLRKPKHTPVFRFNADGFCIGGYWRAPAEGQGKQFIERMHQLHRVQEAPPIVWPEDGWPVDENGRGLSVLEVKGVRELDREQFVIRRHIREFMEAA